MAMPHPTWPLPGCLNCEGLAHAAGYDTVQDYLDAKAGAAGLPEVPRD